MNSFIHRLIAVLACALLLAACSEDAGSTGSTTTDGGAQDADAAADTAADDAEVGATDARDAAGATDADDANDAEDPQSAADADADDTGADAQPDADASPTTHLRCGDDPPPGAPTPPALPAYSEGTCPALSAGRNSIESDGNDREFLLVVPDNLQPDEELPVLFLWHWLGGDAEKFLERGEIQLAADTQRFIAIIPEEKGDLQFRWPYTRATTAWRYDEELTFFDDMLTCVAEQYEVNRHCVSSAGVSAGALWTAQLVVQRSEFLSSFISLSGGVGGDDTFEPIRRWETPDRATPGIVLWGGDDDWCAVDFNEASGRLEDHLEEDGHFFMECVHNCAHSEPPLEGEDGLSRYAGLWEFIFDHPYWLDAGTSPYIVDDLPESAPEWCGIGKGSAQIRQGECGEDGCQ
jgi:predicted esterase